MREKFEITKADHAYMRSIDRNYKGVKRPAAKALKAKMEPKWSSWKMKKEKFNKTGSTK